MIIMFSYVFVNLGDLQNLPICVIIIWILYDNEKCFLCENTVFLMEVTIMKNLNLCLELFEHLMGLNSCMMAFGLQL